MGVQLFLYGNLGPLYEKTVNCKNKIETFTLKNCYNIGI
jgi:hypothetical protein